jgi:acetylornithine deacetylase
MEIDIQILVNQSIELLKQLIQTPSFSKEEEKTGDLIENYLKKSGLNVHRKGNNVWALNQSFDNNKPTILLNSHHDTVKPNQGYTLNPFEALEKDGKLYGLGSNDAGGALVSLMAVFLYFDAQDNLPYNLIFLASAEEEISGKNGVESVLSDLPPIALGIVGEPTLMQAAVAEKGLMVIDAVAKGKAGHAARDEGENAIYKALADIHWIQQYEFEQVSHLLGKVKMTVTQIEAGYQHNVVPDTCKFVIDVRSNELYSNQEIFDVIDKHTLSELTPRSFRLNSSKIDLGHPFIKKAKSMGLSCYGSPTLSDQALMNFPTVKMGPGDSARSHTADEFIYLTEITEGIKIYIQLLQRLVV